MANCVLAPRCRRAVWTEVHVVAPQPSNKNREGFETPDAPELEDAGLYNYLLISSPANRPLIASALGAWLALNPSVASLRGFLKPGERISLTLPVLEKPTTTLDPDWILQHYDFARARTFLAKAVPNSKPGIYILSSLLPLSKSKPPYLIEDLSAATPALAAQWVEAFINEAAQEHSWNTSSIASLADQMRATLLALDPNLRPPLLLKWIALL